MLFNKGDPHMTKPKLIVMAAGLGSRYGGLKQMEPVTAQGEIILDFAVYDAMRAGFNDVIFVIKPEMEDIFKERVLNPIKKYMSASCVFQDISQLPPGYKIPEGRTKPWGTCHAVMAAKDHIDGPFAVINADDYYGAGAFKKVYDFLDSDTDSATYCMAGYLIENTLSEQGTVTRGICSTDDAGFLTEIAETKEIGRAGDGQIISGNRVIPEGTPVSMNFWGFKASFITDFLDREIVSGSAEGKLKAEYLLPVEAGRLLKNGDIKVRVLPASDKWYGVTYREDRDKVYRAFEEMKKEGRYPEKLWP